MKHYRIVSATLLAGLVSSPFVASAGEEEEAPDREYVIEAEEREEKQKEGVDWRLNVGGTVNLSDNRSVVGQTDGSTLTFGFKFDAGVDYREGDHELRNSLGVAAGVTRTPIIDDFIKAHDELAFESIYLYHIVPWFGPYGQFGLETAMFRGTDIRPEPTTYSIERTDGTVDTVLGTRLSLTDPFHPLKLRESVGVFFQPYASDPFTLEFRTGAGGREIIAQDQLAITDDEDTPEVEVTELRDVLQFGAEAIVELWGDVYDKKLFYKASAEAMMPFANNKPDSDDRNAAELTNLAFKAGLSLKIVEWASVDYQFKAIREPQLLDDFQIQNNLLVSFGLAAGTPSDEEE